MNGWRGVVRDPAARRAALATLLVAGALSAPFWAIARFPSQDGPSHVANAWILRSLVTGAGGEPAADFQLNLEPSPNWFTHASLAVLLGLAPPPVAEKLFLSAYVLLLLVSFRYALKALRPEAAPLSLVVAPLACDSALHLGYYNRAFASVPLLLALGFWARRRGRLGAGATVPLALLLLWAYFCAAATLALALSALALCGLAVALEDARPVPGGGRRRLLRLFGALTAAGAPALLLLLRFQARQARSVSFQAADVVSRLRALATLETLVSLDPRERWLSTALGVALAIALLAALAARLRSGGGQWQDALLAAAGLAAVGYLLAPAVQLGGLGPWADPTQERLAPSLLLLFLLWLAAQPLARTWRRLLVVSTLTLALGFAGLRLPRYAALDGQLREYLSVAPWIPEGATLLPLSFAHQGTSREGGVLAFGTWPFRHAADWLVVSRRIRNVDDYETQVSFFPVILRAGYDPYGLLGSSLDRRPECVHLGRFNRLAPRPAEFVLTWGAGRVDRDDPCMRTLVRQLDVSYRRVFVSSPRGLAELYRLVTRPAATEASQPASE